MVCSCFDITRSPRQKTCLIVPASGHLKKKTMQAVEQSLGIDEELCYSTRSRI